MINEEDLKQELIELDIEENAEELILNLSTEGNTFLDYSDFVVATTDWKSCLHIESFSYFIEPGSLGQITITDLRKVVPTVPYADILKFFNTIDTENKGLVSIPQLYERVLYYLNFSPT